MDKNELEFSKAQFNARKFSDACMVGRAALYGISLVACVKLIVDGVVQISERHPTAISAIAHVIEAFHLSDLAWALVSGIATAGWALERRGKKRAVEKLGVMRKRLEGGDPNRSSSKLDKRGNTPAARPEVNEDD